MDTLRLGCAVILLVAGAAHAAGGISAADNKMLHDYALTMQKVKAYEAATENMMVAGKSDASLKAEGEKMSTEPDKTLADVRASGFTRSTRSRASAWTMPCLFRLP